MDEEIDPDGEDANAVLVEESAELLHILSRQPAAVVTELLRMVPGEAACPSQPASGGPEERLQAVLEYFRRAGTAECSSFLGRVCMLCDDIPMRLESRLMSVAGHSSSDHGKISPAASDQRSLSPPADLQIKRPRIDYWELYVAAVRRSLQRRWERLTATQHMLRDVQLDHVWFSPRTTNRGRDRPDQTPGSADRGGLTPEPDGDFVCLESRVTLDSFLQESTGKMTVLTGQAGSGKTLLMSRLGQLWADSLGPIPSSYLFVLLEFRQLNLLLRPLSLSELLFQHYPPPEGGDMAKRTIVEYLLSNPEQSCWVLDGYDEFQGKLSRADPHRGTPGLENSLPVADLISGLLNRQILPGSTVLVTCRLRDVVDLDGVSDKVGQLLGWNHQEIREYVDNFFRGKDKALGEKAADLLFSSRHLLSMSSLPALCNICCICLDYLLLGERRQAVRSSRIGETEKGADGGAQIPPDHKVTTEKDAHTERSTDILGNGTNGGDELFQTTSEVPNTLTQIYLTLLSAFLARCSSQGEDQPNSSRFSQSSLRLQQSKLCELSRLAWKGLEEHKILFLEEELSPDVLKFSIRTGLFTQVELRRQNGTCVKAFSFIHLTVQEFFAALQVMTGTNVSDALLKKRFSLKTRWTTRSDQRKVFTDSLCLFVCGLASPHCTSTLVQLTRTSGEAVEQNWVQKRQKLVLNLLKTRCCSSSLTGPKVLELCHCVQESQDSQLAKQVVSSRPTLELRNIWLVPDDIDALAFVVNSGGGSGIGLDFGACSMELECLDVLPRCENLHFLSFRGRKYEDKFAEKLSSVLPEFKKLKKLEFSGTILTAAGAASLASGLQNCPSITEINLSDNNLKNEGIKHVSAIFTHLQSLQSITLGQNHTSLEGVHCLIEKMSSCSSIQHVHAEGKKDIKVTFSENAERSHKMEHAPSASLLNQNWSNGSMLRLTTLLARCPALSVVDLSGGHWNETILKTLTENLSKINITDKMILNESCSSVKSLLLLTALLTVCPSVLELHIRLKHPVQVSIVFNDETEKPTQQRPKVLCVSSCKLVPAQLERLWSSLGSSSDLTVLDVSSNSLGIRGLQKLLDVLPHLNKIQEINAGNNGINMEGVAMLAAALCSSDNLTQTLISDGGKDQVILKFCSDRSARQQLKTFRMNRSVLPPADITTVCSKLTQCQSPVQFEFICCSLSSEAIKSLIKVLSKTKSLRKLNVSQSITSTADALVLIDCLTHNQNVTAVDISLRDEAFISFDQVKAEEVSCRFTHFILNLDDLKRLLDILKKGPGLSYLDLTGNELGDEGVKILVDSLPELKISHYANLSNNRLTQQGLLHVAWTLCACSNVSGVEVSLKADERCLIWFSQTGSGEKTLRVRESSLEREHLVRLSEIVSTCPTLDKLELRNNSLRLEWIEELMKLLKARETEYTISIEECWMRAENAVHLLCRCLELNGNVQTIGIQQSTLRLSLKSTELTSVCGDSSDPAQTMIARKISLVHCAVDGDHQDSLWRIIQSCAFLTELDFSHSRLGEKGTEFLCSFLPLLPNLTTISLSGHKITDTAAQSLTRLFPRLQSLNLSHCRWSSSAELRLIEALGQCVGLEELCLDLVEMSAEGRTCLPRTLRSIGSLRSLKLNKIATDGHSDAGTGLDLLAAMEELTQIKEMELDGWKISDAGVQQLIRLLPLWKELRKIILSENLISDQSGEKLLDALQSCDHLQELNLSRNALGVLSAARMAVVLPALTRLSVLDISENPIGSQGVARLSKAIMCLKNLSKIHLTSVGTCELCAVTASLAHCPLIQFVGLGWNGCDDQVALELAKVLPVCHKLTWIDLESNRVTLSGAQALVRALKLCPTLQVIRLWKNKISQNEAQMLSLKDRRLNFSPT
ncbi:protein NLRC5 isoform X1 [Salarias fasciatus]|uniref:protein NLRC5 isoform X1 n=1 Tax=Salarias fasciatus TaxID=181472 RepID=UPI001176B3E7|nr:protein NLRC5 isoform X1 [Salarias fasciatus]